MDEFPQTVPNLTASSSNLYELIKSQGLMVYPDDEIRLAVSRAVALETTRGWRIAKEKASHKIDIVVALAMAAYAAVQKGESGFMRMGTYNPYSGDGKVRWKDEPRKQQRPRRQWYTPEEARDAKRKGTMVMVAIGDIVEIRQFRKRRWAVLGPYSHGVHAGAPVAAA